MKKMLFAGAAALAALVATGAQAASTDSGWYGAIDAGVHKAKPITSHATDLNNSAIGYDWNWGTEQSWAGFARLGYRMTPNVRVELEGGYRQGDLSSVLSKSGSASIPAGLCTAGVIRSSASPTCGKPSGHINRYTAMVNGLYDFMPDAYVNPFVGVGAGVGVTDTSVNGQFAKIPTGSGAAIQNLTSSSTKSSIAYQVLAGLAWHPTDRISVDLTYRYLNGADVKFTSTGSGTLQPGKFHGPYEDNSLTIGVPKQFVVYFPFDQSVLTTDAQAVVQAAANYALQGNATRLVVVGHTDTSGSVKYNLALSERRAKVVADSLVGLGVNKDKIGVDWKGKSDLAVPTPNGVKEPLNRRSTIDVNFKTEWGKARRFRRAFFFGRVILDSRSRIRDHKPCIR
eukprot:gene17886-18117_t